MFPSIRRAAAAFGLAALAVVTPATAQTQTLTVPGAPEGAYHLFKGHQSVTVPSLQACVNTLLTYSSLNFNSTAMGDCISQNNPNFGVSVRCDANDIYKNGLPCEVFKMVSTPALRVSPH